MLGLTGKANEPQVSSNYENTDKTMTTDLITKYDAETNISDVEKYQESVPEQNVDEGGANNKQLDKNDTQRIGSGSGSLFFLIFYFFASLFFFGLFWVFFVSIFFFFSIDLFL